MSVLQSSWIMIGLQKFKKMFIYSFPKMEFISETDTFLRTLCLALYKHSKLLKTFFYIHVNDTTRDFVFTPWWFFCNILIRPTKTCNFSAIIMLIQVIRVRQFLWWLGFYFASPLFFCSCSLFVVIVNFDREARE